MISSERKIAIALSCAAIFAASIVAAPKASAWIGEGVPYTGGSSYGYNGGSISCNAQWSNDYRIDCAGLSWIYYEYNEDSNVKTDIKYPFAGGSAGPTYKDDTTGHNPKEFTIPSECVTIGGFWHFGINAKQYEKTRFVTTYNNWHGYKDGIAGDFSYEIGSGGYGHWATSLWGLVTTGGYSGKVLTPASTDVAGKHKIYYKDKVVYTSKKTGDANTDVLSSYKEACSADSKCVNDLKKEGKTVDDIKSMANEVWGFCYAPGMGDKTAKFTATTSVKKGDEDKTVKSSSYTIGFEHVIKRTDGDSFDTKNPWQIKNGPAENKLANKTEGVSSGAGANTNKKGDKQVISKEGAIESGTINPGQTITRCQAINYYGTISTKNGKSDNKDSKPACGTVKRNSAKFTGEITATVKKNASKTTVAPIVPGRRVTLGEDDDGYYEITFMDTISREKDGAGDNVKTEYKYRVDDGAWSKNQDTAAIKEGGSTKPIKEGFVYSGTLDYGETVTRCHSMRYAATQSGSKDWTDATNSKYCITIVRPNRKCAIDSKYNYGANSGQNIGRVGLVNVAINKDQFTWSEVNDSKVDSLGTTYTNSSSDNVTDRANIWLKPGDKIRFADEACAGAFYAIEKSDATGGVHYSTEAKLIQNYGNDDLTKRTSYYNNSNGTDGYLFKNGDSSKPSKAGGKYNNPTNSTGIDLNHLSSGAATPFATWSTGIAGTDLEKSGFLSHPKGKEPVAEMAGSKTTSTDSAKYSPSNSSTGYTICATAGPCKFGYQEVGGVISHRLSWNSVIIENGAVDTRRSASYEHSAEAIAKIPYNYSLVPYVKNETDNGIIYLGETKIMQPGVGVQARENKWVHGKGATYATVTKKTNFRIRVYVQEAPEKGNIIDKSLSNFRLNKNGDPENHSDDSFVQEMFGTQSLEIPVSADGQYEVGQHICTELTIGPVDSHDTGDNRAVFGSYAYDNSNINNPEFGLREDGGTRTATATSCATVAKRPTMSVESSNAYSATSFTTGLYDKIVGKNNNGQNRLIFGSWSEYGVFGKVDANANALFVSGAAVGYMNNTHATSAINSARSNDGVVSHDAPHVASGSVGKSVVCQFMTQTLVNYVDGKDGGCKPSDKDDASIGKSAMESFLGGILARYGNEKFGKEFNETELSAETIVDPEKYRITEKKDADSSEKKDDNDENNSVIAIRTKTKNRVTLKSIPEIKIPNRTIIYNINGDLDITGDINDERDKSVSNLSELTGVVIIANNINISSDVQYINATIIARESLNTCSSDSSIKIKFGDSDKLTSNLCNKAIVFDAPVFTKKLILNRTGGAGNGADSIRRAEIFNLNMADYLWSYYQMTNFGQAVTTFSRELPTRY